MNKIRSLLFISSKELGLLLLLFSIELLSLHFRVPSKICLLIGLYYILKKKKQASKREWMQRKQLMNQSLKPLLKK
jgi:hypothetical protein